MRWSEYPAIATSITPSSTPAPPPSALRNSGDDGHGRFRRLWNLKKNVNPMTEELIDQYDEPWKDALGEYLKEFLELLFPEAHAGIDWSVEPQPLDKEFPQLTATAARGKQIADKLWEVRRLDGAATLVLVHVEIQGQREANFAERILRYGGRIRDEYDCNVVSLVVLADPSPSWRPDRYEFEAWGYRLSLVYPTAKLLDLRIEDLEGSRNPFAPIVLAHRMTQAGRALNGSGGSCGRSMTGTMKNRKSGACSASWTGSCGCRSRWRLSSGKTLNVLKEIRICPM